MRASLSAGAVLALVVSGCAVFLPKHPRSQQVKTERVTLTMLTVDDFNALAARIGHAPLDAQRDVVSFTEPAPGEEGARFAFAAAAAPIVAGMVVDYVKKELKEEATRYEAQFTARVAEDLFWLRDGGRVVQHYVGFRVTRTTADYGPSSPAFELVCLLRPSRDGRVLKLTPVYLKIAAAKAKILGHRWWAPWTRLMGDEELEADVDLDLHAIWVADDNVAHVETLAAFTFEVTGYDMSEAPGLTDPAQPFGWFPGVPRSKSKQPVAPAGFGTFWITVKVTERDSSRAKQFVERSVKELENQRDNIVDLVKNRIATTTTMPKAKVPQTTTTTLIPERLR